MAHVLQTKLPIYFHGEPLEGVQSLELLGLTLSQAVSSANQREKLASEAPVQFPPSAPRTSDALLFTSARF